MQRHLSNLKLISRLLGHELHSQGGSKTVTLSRDEVAEIQNTIDLFIEEASRTQGKASGGGFSISAGGGRSAAGLGNLGSGSGSDSPVLPARN